MIRGASITTRCYFHCLVCPTRFEEGFLRHVNANTNYACRCRIAAAVDVRRKWLHAVTGGAVPNVIRTERSELWSSIG